MHCGAEVTESSTNKQHHLSLKVYMELGSYFLFLQEQIKDIIIKLLTVETESRLGTFWDEEQCMQLCSKDELWEAAKEKEMKIPWKEANEESPVSEEQHQERFWRRRLDGIGLQDDDLGSRKASSFIMLSPPS